MAEPITVTITNLNSPIRTAKVSNKVAESAVTSVAGRVGDILLTQSDVAGLENVNNTSDLNKPISTATQAALDANGNGDMLASNNLSDVTNAATSRTNLGLAIGTDVHFSLSTLQADFRCPHCMLLSTVLTIGINGSHCPHCRLLFSIQTEFCTPLSSL